MKTSIATVSISGTLETKLRAVADAGFDGVEIFEQDLLSFPGTPRDVGRTIRDLGLACTLFQPFRDFEGMPPEQRARAFDRMERKFDVMADLGTDLILLCSNCSPLAADERARILDDFAELGERAAKRTMRVGYEALAWGRHIHDHRDAWGIVRDVDHPNIGLILDSFHSLSRKVPSASIGDIDPAKLFLVQIADAPLLDMDYLSWSRHFRNMPGQGDFALDDYARAIARTGYDGYWSLEIFNDRFRAGSASGVAIDGYRSLQLMNDAVAPAMPPRVIVKGVEFIEFAASDEEAEALGTMLGALGFVPTGKHRSKAVTRWQQGAINIVLNAEPDGFAHSFDIVHGASVCAMGLRVKNVSAALERAKALGIAQFSQAVGPDEMQIPSVRGVGGSLLNFIEDGSQADVWATEFEPLFPSSSGEGPGVGTVRREPQDRRAFTSPTPTPPLKRRGLNLTRIDHIAQTMQYEEFLSWLLYYLALFDVIKTPQIEIADTLGLVQSQAVESRDKALRITLNGSMGSQTLSSRFVQNYMGAGVQHIAFESADVFAAAEAAKTNGLQMLDISRNYYDDLESRFALDRALIDRMAALNILYDSDGEAEYFQFYSRAFANRVFFEVVERRGYDAYGAANATIRLASQARFKSDSAD